MRKSYVHSAWVVSEKTDDGNIVEYEGQKKVEEAIYSKIHDERLYAAEKAPICQVMLGGEFGYQADTQAARQVLDGTYNYTEDFDPPTKELLDECAWVRTIIPARSVNINLKRGGWQHRWGKAKEKTSSSVSGLHFSHYKAGAKSDLISHLHALKTSVALRREVFLARWAKGLSVMLENILVCTLLTKLRTILLMEADFNHSNK